MNDERGMWAEFLGSWQKHFQDRATEEEAKRAQRLYRPTATSKHKNGPNWEMRELRAEHVERCIAQSEDEFHASAGGRWSLRPFKLAWKKPQVRKKLIADGLQILAREG